MADVIDRPIANPVDTPPATTGDPGRLTRAVRREPLRQKVFDVETLTRGKVRLDPVGEFDDLTTRLLTGFLGSRRAKVDFLRERFGADNVVVTRAEGEILIKPKGSETFVPFNERRIGFGDAADFAGTLAGIASPLGREAVAIALTGQLGQSLPELAQDVFFGKVEDLAEKDFKGGQGPGNPFLTLNLAASAQNKMMKQADRAQRAQISRVGALVDKPATLEAQVAADEGREGRSLLDFHDNDFKERSVQLRETIRGLGSNPGDSAEAADTVFKALNETKASAVAQRRLEGVIKFGEADRVLGSRRVVPVTALVSRMQTFIDELEAPGASDAAKELAARVKGFRDSLLTEDGPRRLTALQAGRVMRIFNDVLDSGGDLFIGMDPRRARIEASRLKAAFSTDIKEAVRLEGGEDSEFGSILNDALFSDKSRSDVIKEIFNSAFQRLMGNRIESREAIAAKLLAGLTPERIQNMMGIIDANSPETAHAIREMILENAFTLGSSVPNEQGVRFFTIDFENALPSAGDLAAFGFSNDEIANTMQLAGRLEDVAGRFLADEPGPSSAIGWDEVRGVFTLDDGLSGGEAPLVLTPRLLSKAASTDQGMQSLFTLTDASAGEETIDQATTSVTAHFAFEPDVIRQHATGLGRDGTFTLPEAFDFLQDEQDIGAQ